MNSEISLAPLTMAMLILALCLDSTSMKWGVLAQVVQRNRTNKTFFFSPEREIFFKGRKRKGGGEKKRVVDGYTIRNGLT